MAKRKPPERARSARRAHERAAGKLARQRERLFDLEAGGKPEHPIDVESASVVEPRARSIACPRCESPFRIEAHLAPSSEGMRLREVQVQCPRCATRRSIWFRLTGPSLN
jgi:DNA-directed RNA polymerase subunit RPC12/RpoP